VIILQCWFTGFDPHFCLFLKKKQNCFSTGETLVPENSGADLTRCLKKNKRTDDLTSLNIKRTDLARSSEKKRTCSGGKTTKSLISGLLVLPFISAHGFYSFI
jgi:hypothetical protein